MGNKSSSTSRKNQVARSVARDDLNRAAARLDQQIRTIQGPSSDPTSTSIVVATTGRAEEKTSSDPDNPVLRRIRECLAREGKPLVRDELFALVLTLRPTTPVELLRGMRVEDLNRQLRALIVDIGLDNMAAAQEEGVVKIEDRQTAIERI